LGSSDPGINYCKKVKFLPYCVFFTFSQQEIHAMRRAGSRPRTLIRYPSPHNFSHRLDFKVDTVRIDKWLWAARFFKTRALASRACDLGRIESNGFRAKPARDVRPGDRLQIENDAGRFAIDVLGISHIRGPASVAQTLYRETEASHEARLRVAEERKTMQQYAPLPVHRPSKRDRRRIIQFRGRA
jgi:ribosome-associated heat shock protein Hsp15